MSATVQAVCPSCRNVLRIPIDWADRALKCKKCGTAVQARRKTAPPAEPTPALAATATAPATTVATPIPPQPPAPPHYPQVPPGYAPQAPQPYGYGQPQQPYAVPPGYPQPYAVPPGYPQPYAYAPTPYGPPVQAPVPYPLPAPQPYPGEEMDFGDDGNPRRKRAYKPGGSSRWMGPLLALVLCGGLVGGAYYVKKNVIDKDRVTTVPAGGAETSHAAVLPKDNKTPPAAITGDPYPRRMLFVHISKYIYFNNLTPGTGRPGEDMPTRTAKKLAFEWRVPMDKANNQLFVLSDTSPEKDTRPAIKSVVEKAIGDFCDTSRAQDRVAIYFGGHATEIDGKAYLVPAEGEQDVVESLIPLEQVFAKLKECKAQQKILLLDVCRFNTAYGAAKPGSQPMTQKLDELLHAAPEGVLVITSCSAGENAHELQETGSEFLTAFRIQADRIKSTKQPIPSVEDPMPVQQWSDAVKAYLGGKRDNRQTQTVKFAGEEGKTTVAYNKEEPLPPRFAWADVPKGISIEDINSMLQTASIPGLRKDLEMPTSLGQIYPFKAEVMKAYTDDGITEEQIRKDPEKYPVRFAALESFRIIREQWTFGDNGLRESFDGASVDDKAKKDALAEQNGPALIELELKEQMQRVEKIAKTELANEKSKRWQALFQYATAQLQLRWAFIEEYRGAMGKIRTDSLPKPEKGKAAGYRLASSMKMSSKKDIVEKAEEAREILAKMADDHKGTPWEVVAKMHKNVALGLKWEVIPEEAKEEEKMEGMEKKSDTTTPMTAVSFEKVQAVLRSHCFTCHGTPQIRAGIDLRTLESINKKPGLLTPGDPAKSDLWGAIMADTMPPPDKPRMTAADKQLIKDWIMSGAK